MARIIQSSDLEEWEVFASTGPNGFPDPARIVFRCRTDASKRPVAVDIQGDKAEAERDVVGKGDDELLRLLAEAEEID
jgi:hypothetical protein